MTDGMGEQMQMFDRDTWCGKTSPVPSAQTVERTSESSSKKRSKSSIPKFLYLDLTRENGLTQGASWETGTASLGELWMHNFMERHSEGAEYILYVTSTERPLQTSYLNMPVINVSEAPIYPIESHLSDILEKNPDPKYNLSSKACQGIIRRAERRGKELPELLRAVLERQAQE